MTPEDKILAIANEKLNRETKLGVADLEYSLKDIGIDSLDFLLILVGIQEEMNVNIPDDSVPNLTTLKCVADFVKTCPGQSQP